MNEQEQTNSGLNDPLFSEVYIPLYDLDLMENRHCSLLDEE